MIQQIGNAVPFRTDAFCCAKRLNGASHRRVLICTIERPLAVPIALLYRCSTATPGQPGPTAVQYLHRTRLSDMNVSYNLKPAHPTQANSVTRPIGLEKHVIPKVSLSRLNRSPSHVYHFCGTIQYIVTHLQCLPLVFMYSVAMQPTERTNVPNR